MQSAFTTALPDNGQQVDKHVYKRCALCYSAGCKAVCSAGQMLGQLLNTSSNPRGYIWCVLLEQLHTLLELSTGASADHCSDVP